MTKNFTSPLAVDFDGLRIPAGTYALPSRADVSHLGTDTADRFSAHFAGRLPVSSLTAAEVTFLQEHFLEQHEARVQAATVYFDEHVPRRYKGVMPDAQATDWAGQFARDPHAVQSLLVLGPTGSGKTHLAYSVLAAVAGAGAFARWEAVTEADMFARLRPRHGHDTEAAFEALATCPLLLLDDLGAAKLSEWTEEITYRLVNLRYNHCLPSLVTSNVLPRHFTERFGDRVTSRLIEMCDRISLKNDDLRREGQA
ncbi:ATP-binding protein [Streptomyces sp. NPDC059759]|uniref:ATP-binding protein n=1 Tax=Streptomyces sp. NPDC059759 TaxID=3346936 RepID=UPI003663BA39